MSRDGWENRDKRHCPRVYTVIPEKILVGIRLPSYLLRPSQLYVRTEGLLYSSLTTFKSSSKAKQRYISGKRCSRHSWFIVSETKHDFFYTSCSEGTKNSLGERPVFRLLTCTRSSNRRNCRNWLHNLQFSSNCQLLW